MVCRVVPPQISHPGRTERRQASPAPVGHAGGTRSVARSRGRARACIRAGSFVGNTPIAGEHKLAAGDHAAFRDTCRKVFEKDSKSNELGTRDEVAWLAVQSAAATADWDPYVTLAQNTCQEKPGVALSERNIGGDPLSCGPFLGSRVGARESDYGRQGKWNLVDATLSWARRSQPERPRNGDETLSRRSAEISGSKSPKLAGSPPLSAPWRGGRSAAHRANAREGPETAGDAPITACRVSSNIGQPAPAVSRTDVRSNS